MNKIGRLNVKKGNDEFDSLIMLSLFGDITLCNNLQPSTNSSNIASALLQFGLMPCSRKIFIIIFKYIDR